MNQTIAQFLKVKDFPFIIKDKNGKEIYQENSDGFWTKREYNAHGNQIYVERSTGIWYKNEYDARGNEIYFEDSDGYWSKREYDAQGNEIYFENSDGTVINDRPRVVEMTLQEVADKLGVDVKNIRIKE